MRRLITVLLFVPCIGMCGLFAVQQTVSHRMARELKAEGERFVAALDGGAAGAVPEHFTYRPLDDGGFALCFPEPAFFVPTDFFYVWEASERRWVQREASELP